MTEWPTGIIDGTAVIEAAPGFDQPPADSARERRAHARAYRYWDRLRGERRLPAIADLDPQELQGFAANSVLFDIETPRGAPKVRFVGAELAAEAGAEVEAPERIVTKPGTLLGELACRLPLIAATGAPLDFEAEFLGQAATPTLYRGVLLPFSGSSNRATFIYGVVTWKTMAGALDADIRSAVGSALSLPFLGAARSPWDEETPVAEPAPLPSRSFAQRLAAAQTWAALAQTDHAHRSTSLHAALSAAHDFLVAEEQAVGAPDEAETAAVVGLVFGEATAHEQRMRYRAVLDQAMRLRLGAGALSPLLDRYEGGIDDFLSTETVEPPREFTLPTLKLAAIDGEALAAALARPRANDTDILPIASRQAS